MSESSVSYESVNLKSCGDASPPKLSEEMSSRSIHGDGVRFRFPSSADTGDNGEFSSLYNPGTVNDAFDI